MKYGHFDDIRKEYVITNPKTPYPWINYLGTEDFFSIISNTAGGYSFYKDARLRRITRFRYNNVPIDNEGRYFFINDGSDIWNIGFKPTKTTLDSYRARHGLGYTKFETEKNELYASQLVFVPLKDTCEINYITLTNRSNQTKTIDLNSYLEWCFWDALDDMTNFQRNFNIAEVEVEDNTIYHKTEYRERRNHYAFYSCNQPIDGFDTDRETFIGLYNDISSPKNILENKSSNTICESFAACANHHLKLELKPGETKDFVFSLGYIENDEEDKFIEGNIINKTKAKALINKYKDASDVENALLDLSKYWENLLGKYHIESSDSKLNRMVNIWNQYQNVTCYNFSRSASYFESGVGRGMGFRDSNQDLLGFMHLDTEKSRQRLLDLAATLFPDGSCYHQYSPLTKRGNANLGSGFNDDSSWFVLAATMYIKESGDYSILREMVEYNNDSNHKGSFLEHIQKAYSFTMNNLGPHGLPLIGRADWNDCLNLNCFSDKPGESFQTVENKGSGTVAESVFIAGLFSYAGKHYLDLLRKLDMSEEASIVHKELQDMEQSVINYGYDGDWYLRAYDAYGKKVGSNENLEGKIFIEPQGMCTMAGIGSSQGLPEKAMKSARKYLDSKYGMSLNYPAYSKYYLELGEISSYPEGFKENGAIFCHNNTWMICAEASIGHGDLAFDTYKKITPAYLEDISDVHRVEPYAYCQMIAGQQSNKHGEGKNSWLSGTSAWSFVGISQFILGVYPELDGLTIKPCLPKEIKEYTLTRKFRNVTYIIHFKKDLDFDSGIYKNNKFFNHDFIEYNEDNLEQAYTCYYK